MTDFRRVLTNKRRADTSSYNESVDFFLGGGGETESNRIVEWDEKKLDEKSGAQALAHLEFAEDLTDNSVQQWTVSVHQSQGKALSVAMGSPLVCFDRLKKKKK